MKNKFLYPVFYMFVITAVLSAIVIGFAQLTNERVEANRQIAFERAILSVLPVDRSALTSDLAVHNYFNQNIEQPSKVSGGAYVFRKDGDIAAYALPMEGQGFWAPIKAVVGIANDKKTVTGFAVYQQSETPGLGAEVAQESFVNQFNKVILDESLNAVGFRRAGESLQPHEVHAVTGATQTSTRLEKIINDAIRIWRVEMKNQ